jgi:hypothetical protein
MFGGVIPQSRSPVRETGSDGPADGGDCTFVAFFLLELSIYRTYQFKVVLVIH